MNFSYSSIKEANDIEFPVLNSSNKSLKVYLVPEKVRRVSNSLWDISLGFLNFIGL